MDDFLERMRAERVQQFVDHPLGALHHLGMLDTRILTPRVAERRVVAGRHPPGACTFGAPHALAVARGAAPSQGQTVPAHEPIDPSPLAAMTIRRVRGTDGQLWVNAEDIATALAMLELEARSDDGRDDLDAGTVDVVRRIVDKMFD